MSLGDETTAILERIATVARMVEGLDKKATANSTTLAERGADLRGLRIDVEKVASQVRELHTAIHLGNGKEALTTRLVILERDIAALLRWRKESERDAVTLQRERDKERRSAKSQLVAVVIGGLFSLAVAGISLIKSFS
jgi:hypothetical protein